MRFNLIDMELPYPSNLEAKIRTQKRQSRPGVIQIGLFLLVFPTSSKALLEFCTSI